MKSWRETFGYLNQLRDGWSNEKILNQNWRQRPWYCYGKAEKKSHWVTGLSSSCKVWKNLLRPLPSTEILFSFSHLWAGFSDALLIMEQGDSEAMWCPRQVTKTTWFLLVACRTVTRETLANTQKIQWCRGYHMERSMREEEARGPDPQAQLLLSVDEEALSRPWPKHSLTITYCKTDEIWVDWGQSITYQ
jgi:hypothetical protein